MSFLTVYIVSSFYEQSMNNSKLIVILYKFYFLSAFLLCTTHNALMF